MAKMPVRTEDRSLTKHSAGRPPVVLDPAEVQEEAAKPFRTDAGIATALGITPKTLTAVCDRDEAVAEAYARGKAMAANELAKQIEKRIQDSKTHPVLLVAAANQKVEKGGLGWSNPSMRHEHSGRIEHVLTPAQEAYEKMIGGRDDEKDKAIEAEFSEVVE